MALAQRIKKGGGPGTFHAVSVASTYEQGVLEAIASIGGGSGRAAGDHPAAAAFALLKEVAPPPVKNLVVRCEGLRTAAVYPERLPNLAPCTQQIVIGRFLPQGATQKGRAVVEGTLNDQPLRLASEVTLRQDEEGNSFLPRPCARRHADALLAQGSSPEVQKLVVVAQRRVRHAAEVIIRQARRRGLPLHYQCRDYAPLQITPPRAIRSRLEAAPTRFLLIEPVARRVGRPSRTISLRRLVHDAG